MKRFDQGVIAELEAIEELLLKRRAEVVGRGVSTDEAFGRVFALGAVDSAVWRLLRRAKGEEVADG